MGQPQATLEELLDDLVEAGEGPEISVGDVLESFEHRSVAVLLTLFGLVAALPVIGAVPGMSIGTGILILIVVGRSFLGGQTLWFPRFLRRRRMRRGRFRRGVEKARPALRWLDRRLSPRLGMLVRGPARRRAAGVAAGMLALTFFPLAFIPWGTTAPSIGVVMLGLGLMAGDGLFVLIGYLFAATTIGVMVALL